MSLIQGWVGAKFDHCQCKNGRHQVIVFCTEALTQQEQDDITTNANARFILVEFSTSYLPQSYLNIFAELMDLGVTPIMAHPERYMPIYEDFSVIKKLYPAGSVHQLDIIF